MTCYSHYESDADFPPGASNEAPANVVCRPVEWKYPQVDLGPEAMFFIGDSPEAEFEIWAVMYTHNLNRFLIHSLSKSLSNS